MTVPDEQGRPVPDPGLETLAGAGPTARQLVAVAGVALVTLAALVALAVHAGGGGR